MDASSWTADLFSYYEIGSSYPYHGLAGTSYSECLPYNEDTAKLLGTTDSYA